MFSRDALAVLATILFAGVDAQTNILNKKQYNELKEYYDTAWKALLEKTVTPQQWEEGLSVPMARAAASLLKYEIAATFNLIE